MFMAAVDDQVAAQAAAMQAAEAAAEAQAREQQLTSQFPALAPAPAAVTAAPRTWGVGGSSDGAGAGGAAKDAAQGPQGGSDGEEEGEEGGTGGSAGAAAGAGAGAGKGGAAAGGAGSAGGSTGARSAEAVAFAEKGLNLLNTANQGGDLYMYQVGGCAWWGWHLWAAMRQPAGCGLHRAVGPMCAWPRRLEGRETGPSFGMRTCGPGIAPHAHVPSPLSISMRSAWHAAPPECSHALMHTHRRLTGSGSSWIP